MVSKPRPKGTIIDTIVLHATGGSTVVGALDALREKGLGYHYIVDQNGHVYKAVSAADETYHAGSSYGPHEAKEGLSRAQKRTGEFIAGCSVNTYSVGVSLVNLNNGKDPYDHDQIEALIELLKAIKAQIPTIKYLTTHAIVSPGRKTDPRGLNLDSVAAAVGLTPWRYTP